MQDDTPIINAALEAAALYYRDELARPSNPRSRKTRGAAWRDGLRRDWMRAGYPAALRDHAGTLQRIRNMRGGFERLDSFRASFEVAP